LLNVDRMLNSFCPLFQAAVDKTTATYDPNDYPPEDLKAKDDWFMRGRFTHFDFDATICATVETAVRALNIDKKAGGKGKGKQKRRTWRPKKGDTGSAIASGSSARARDASTVSEKGKGVQVDEGTMSSANGRKGKGAKAKGGKGRDMPGDKGEKSGNGGSKRKVSSTGDERSAKRRHPLTHEECH